MKKSVIPLLVLIFPLLTGCQPEQEIDDEGISTAYVREVLTTLSADEMGGRRAFSSDARRAAEFIAGEFQRIGLDTLEGENSYLQPVSGRGREGSNVAGMIRGAGAPEEYVVFSAHYDHIGILEPVDGDSIANGADDNASGTTAVITLADYFMEQGPGHRTLIFVAFTGEEMGGFGARHFSRQLDPEKVVAMFNIEMIGKPSRFGPNSAFMTGFDKSDLGTVIQRNLENTPYEIHPDPYPEQNLFYRSDNATLARLGVPAHTISSVQIDIDDRYHTVNDEAESLDMDHMAGMIRAIALGSRSIVSGEDTPARIDTTEID